MGFKFEPRIAVITFEEPFEGLEIRASLDLPALRQMRLVKQLAALQAVTEGGDEEQAEDALRQAADLFLTVTEGWNYETSDGPLPMTADTLLNAIPGNLFFQLVSRWAETVRGVSAPLAAESPSPVDLPESPIRTPEIPSLELVS